MRHATARGRLDPRKNLVGFLVGNVQYAIDIWRVREIVQPLPLTPLPFTHPSIVGVADHRGEVVPVVDLRRQFGEQTETSRKTKWILLNASDRVVGIVVDVVIGPFGAAEEQMRAPPTLGGGEQRRGILTVTSHQEKMVFVIDPLLIEEIIQPALDRGFESALPVASLETNR
jgi:purine-binding chemotaxis protein CheW